jgi:hypothetical protein
MQVLFAGAILPVKRETLLQVRFAEAFGSTTEVTAPPTVVGL